MAWPMLAPFSTPSESATPGFTLASTSRSIPLRCCSRAASWGKRPANSKSCAGATPSRARSGAEAGSRSTSETPPPGSAACACAAVAPRFARKRAAMPCADPEMERETSPGRSRSTTRRGSSLPAGARSRRSCAPSTFLVEARSGSAARLCSRGRVPAAARRAAGSSPRATSPYPRTTPTATRPLDSASAVRAKSAMRTSPRASSLRTG